MMGFFLMMLRYSFVEWFGDLALSLARQLVFAVVGRPTRRRATTLSWTEDNFKLQCKASTAMVWAQLLPLWRKLFAVAVEGDLLGEDATAHVRQNTDGIIWIDSAGGEDDAVDAAFFFKFLKAGLGTSSRNAQSSFERLYVVSDSGFRHVFMVVARRIDNVGGAVVSA